MRANSGENTRINDVIAKRKTTSDFGIYEKYRKETYKAKSIWHESEVISEQGTMELSELDLANEFNFPKPSYLIKKILQLGSDHDSIVLDFSAGSGTTAQAVLDLNKQDDGTKEFRRDWVHEIFKNKILKFDAKNPRAADDPQFEHFVSAKDWFAFNTVYGTSEEKAFVRMLDRRMSELARQYDKICLLRNEEHFAIYNFSDGQAFQPDFVLFLREKNGDLLTYQLFIEPKGRHIKEHDRLKESFLKEITRAFVGRLLTLDDKKYRLIGASFYNNKDENKFSENLESALNYTV